MEPLSETDVLIKNYVKDQPGFCECWEFETTEGDIYRICTDQDGGEWVEEL